MAKPVIDAQPSPKMVTAITGERRQVTAMFYDIVGSTQLLQQLDPEDFALLQRRIHGEAAAAVRGNGGYLESLHGDGGSAYFGFPESLEDAAECAVNAALELVARCQVINEDADPGALVRVRVGLATGTVVISDLKDAALPLMKEVIGITPALASRIQTEAEPNSVAVADTTYRLTRGAFDFHPLGERSLKGMAEPVRLWKPTTRRHPVDRFTASRRHQAPLVGRAGELDLCRGRWNKAREGHGRMILVVGEAGIGKSRLVAELRQDVTSSKADARILQCLSRGNSRPLHPFVDTLKHEIRGSASGPVALEPQEILDFLKSEGVDASEETASVIAFLSGGDGLSASGDAGASDRSAEDLRQAAIDAMFAILAARSRQKPQCLIIEDVHWADTLTQDMIGQLADRIESLPILVVLTAREDGLPGFSDRHNVLTITLSRLDAHETPQLLESLWGGRLPSGLASFIHDKSDGVPLFAEELANLFKDRFQDNQATSRDWKRSLRESSIVTLQDLVSVRLAALGPSRRVAQIASVIGREFESDLLSQLMNGDRVEAPLDEALEHLTRARIIQRQNGGDHAVYRFRHALIQEAAYDSLLRTDRRMMHGRVVDLVLSDAAAAPPDDVLAWHCEQAGRWLEGARFAIRAAEGYALRSAIREAEQLLAQADEDLSRCEASADVDELALQLLAARGPVAIAIFGKGSPEARAVYEHGVAICRRREVEDRERWFPLYWGWWYTSPDRQTKRSRSDVLIGDLDQANDPEIRLQSLHCAWAANFHAGQHGLCMDCIDRGLRLYDPERGLVSRSRYGGHDANVCGLGERAQLLWLMGDPKGADESIREALTWAEAIDHTGSLCHALDNAILLATYERDISKVADLARRMRSLADEHDLPEVRAKSRIYAGWALALSGSLDDGLKEFEDGLAIHNAIGTDEDMPVYNSLRAELLVRSRQTDRALSILNDAIVDAERAGNVVWLPELYRQRAVTWQSHGPDRGTSHRDFEQAIALAQQQGATALADRARADLDRHEHDG